MTKSKDSSGKQASSRVPHTTGRLKRVVACEPQMETRQHHPHCSRHLEVLLAETPMHTRLPIPAGSAHVLASVLPESTRRVCDVVLPERNRGIQPNQPDQSNRLDKVPTIPQVRVADGSVGNRRWNSGESIGLTHRTGSLLSLIHI